MDIRYLWIYYNLIYQIWMIYTNIDIYIYIFLYIYTYIYPWIFFLISNILKYIYINMK